MPKALKITEASLRTITRTTGTSHEDLRDDAAYYSDYGMCAYMIVDDSVDNLGNVSTVIGEDDFHNTWTFKTPVHSNVRFVEIVRH